MKHSTVIIFKETDKLNALISCQRKIALESQMVEPWQECVRECSEMLLYLESICETKRAKEKIDDCYTNFLFTAMEVNGALGVYEKKL